MKKQQTIIRRYESISALARHVQALGDTRQDGANDASERQFMDIDEWSMGQTLGDSLEMSLSGGNWEQGAESLQKVNIDTMAHGMAEILEPAIVHGVTGGALDIGEYLADSPECFFQLDEVEQSKPIVKIGVCTVPSASVNSEALMNHGRAIIALVEALELQQYSVELTAVWPAVACEYPTYIAETVIKQAGEPWSAPSVAYALAHTGFSRRLGFRALESDPDCWDITNRSYGNGMLKPEQTEQYDLYFPYLTSNGPVQTPKRALEYVTNQAKRQHPELIKSAA